MVEAVSILSQLAYVEPGTASAFAANYAWDVGFVNLPIYAPIAPYTPLYSEFTYASGYRLEPSTPNGYHIVGSEWNEFGKPELRAMYSARAVGRQRSYDHTLFLMTRDMAVLTALDRVKPAKRFYCVWNEDPIESNLSESAFKVEFNVKTVYSCTGTVHDAHVPKCVCPAVPPLPELTALAARIKAYRAAAPFAVRLCDLSKAAADAHKAAVAVEPRANFRGLLTNFAPRVDKTKWGSADFMVVNVSDDDDLQRLVPDMDVDYVLAASAQRQDTVTRVSDARAAADAADAELAAYISAQEDAAFAVFKPEVRSILSAMRANALDGYIVPLYPITSDDLSQAQAL